MKILVVDDSPTMRRITESALEQVGHQDIVCAVDGEEALRRLEEASFDLIITDWHMPGMGGLLLTQKVRASRHYSHIPMLLLTTRCSEQDIKEAQIARVNDFITKPFTPGVLKDTIQRVLRGQEEKRYEKPQKSVAGFKSDQHDIPDTRFV